jgi:hypothetical protein
MAVLLSGRSTATRVVRSMWLADGTRRHVTACAAKH